MEENLQELIERTEFNNKVLKLILENLANNLTTTSIDLINTAVIGNTLTLEKFEL